MSDKDSKKHRDIESEVIDTLLDAIDDWDLDGDLGIGSDSSAPAPTSEAPFQTTSSSATPSPVQNVGKSLIREESPPSADQSAPLYVPSLELEDEDDEESTRMIDMRADERYHNLVRSSRADDEKPITDDMPTPVPDVLPDQKTVIASAPLPKLVADDDESTTVATERPGLTSDEEETVLADLSPRAGLISDEEETIAEAASSQKLVSDDEETALADLPPRAGLISDEEETLQASPSSRGLISDDEETAIATTDPRLGVDEALLDANVDAPLPRPSTPPSGDAPVSPSDDEEDKPRQPSESNLDKKADGLEPERAGRAGVKGASRRPLVKGALRSGVAVVHMGESGLPRELISLLDGLLPEQEIDIPSPDRAYPETDELLERVLRFDAKGVLTEGDEEAPESVAARSRVAAEGCEEASESARLFCESARVYERQVHDNDRARELYSLAAQLDPKSLVAVSGRRRLAAREKQRDAFAGNLQAELELELSDEERIELLFLWAHAQLAGDDPGEAVDTCDELPDEVRSDLRAALIRVEAAFCSENEEELARQVECIADGATDEVLLAALSAIAGIAKERLAESDEAGRLYRRAVDKAPGSPSALAGMARVALATGAGVDAAEAFLAMTELFADGQANASLTRRAASLFVAADQPERAREALEASSADVEWAIVLSVATALDDKPLRARALVEMAKQVEEPLSRASLLLDAVCSSADDATGPAMELLGSCLNGPARAAGLVLQSELNRGRELIEELPLEELSEVELSPVAMFRNALARDGRGQVDKVRELFIKLSKVERTALEAELALSILDAEEGNWLSLTEHLERFRDSAISTSYEAAIEEVIGWINEHMLVDEETARRAFARVLEIEPASTGALLGSWRLAESSSKRLEVARRIAEGTTSVVSAVERLTLTAKQAVIAGDDRVAAEAYEEALEREPKAVQALLAAADVLLQLGRIDDLLALWQRAEEHFDLGLRGYNALRAARLLLERHDVHGAIDGLMRVLGDGVPEPSVVELIARHSQTSAKAERLEQLVDVLPGVRKLPALIRSAELRADDDPEGAFSCVQRALELEPSRFDVIRLRERLMMTLLREDELEAEIEAVLRASDDQGERAALQRKLVEVAALQGDLPAEAARREAYLGMVPDHFPTLHWLASRYLSDQRWEDLARIYGLMAREVRGEHDAAAFAAMAIRLSAVSGGRYFEQLELATLAYEKRPDDLLALYNLYFTSTVAESWELAFEAAKGLSRGLSVPRCRGIYALRAADFLESFGREEEALEYLALASEGDEPHPVGPWRRSRLAEGLSDYGTAAESAMRSAELSRVQQQKTNEYLRAARLYLDRVGDKEGALAALRGAMLADPGCEEAFDLAREVMDEGTDPSLALELIASRLASERSEEEIIDLGMSGARLAFEIDQRGRAKEMLAVVLETDPKHLEALERLAEAYAEDEEWDAAAQRFFMLARTVSDPSAARDFYYRLGVIYHEKAPDARRAISAFQKVISFEPTHLEALRRLSVLLIDAREWQAAADTTARLIEIEPDVERKRDELLRIAQAFEIGLSDSWNAERALDEARRLDPTELSVVVALADYYRRQGAEQALMVHLDRAATDYRRLLEADAYDLDAYHALFRVLVLRRNEDGARLVASVLDVLNDLVEEERELLVRLGGASWVPTPALADVRLDEELCPPSLTRALRVLFQTVGDSLGRLHPQDVRKLGLGRGQRLGRGSPVWELARGMAGWYGLSGIDIYVHQGQPTIWAVFMGSTPSLVLGQALIEGAEDGEIRFFIGRAMALLQRKLVILQQLEAKQLGLLVPAIARTVYPTYEVEGVNEGELAGLAREVGRALPRRLRQQAGPLALECVGQERGGAEVLNREVVEFADRAGLLASGGLQPALMALRRMGGLSSRPSSPGGLMFEGADPRLGALLRFYVSRSHFAVRSRLGQAAPI